MRTGFAELPLHYGRAPAWLFQQMVRLAREVLAHIVTEYGSNEVLSRLSDPFWFQAFGCVLGFDWHSSGLTTTTCGAVKEAVRGIEKDLGFRAAGGKGSVSRKTPVEIVSACEHLSLNPEPLVYASRLSAKVDSAALQDGYQIYHHSFFFTAQGQWAVVQQGMSERTGRARRYHWLGSKLGSFVSEPHQAVCCDHRGKVLNLVATESASTQDASVELATRYPERVMSSLQRIPNLIMPTRHDVLLSDVNRQHLRKVLEKTYASPPASYEELLGLRGVGARTLRALALVAELIYGTRASTRDPARFAFAHGGKDGTPFPVDRVVYEHTICTLHRALDRARLDRHDKIGALKRLTAFAAPPHGWQ
ncbi:MAG: DUF763 domain-containing protein [Acidobacteria bacterium]|nr:DUF763 domain-containing protein [Acidobacteriota bacterium]